MSAVRRGLACISCGLPSSCFPHFDAFSCGAASRTNPFTPEDHLLVVNDDFMHMEVMPINKATVERA
eukprot:6181310-Pleurochrysis_carterae.AAC.3